MQSTEPDRDAQVSKGPDLLSKTPSYTVFVCGASANSLVNFRGPLIEKLVRGGHRVVATAGPADEQLAKRLALLGAEYLPLPVKRSPLSVLSDLRYVLALSRAMQANKPDAVVAYTHKPIVCCGLALRLTRSKARFIAMITGLGFAFATDTSRAIVARRLLVGAYSLVSGCFSGAILQNADDLSEAKTVGLVRRRTPTIVVRGSGVDLSRFSQRALPAGPPRFLMIARLLKDKGVLEYLAAAAFVRSRFPRATFELVGGTDANPSSVTQSELERLRREGIVTFIGAVADVRPYLESCSVFVLPSYREGCPRTVLEAMAVGRPIVTTDVPGCRETIANISIKDDDGISAGENGLVVPPRNAGALGLAMLRLATSPGLVQSMATQSRRIAESDFDANRVAADIAEFVVERISEA